MKLVQRQVWRNDFERRILEQTMYINFSCICCHLNLSCGQPSIVDFVSIAHRLHKTPADWCDLSAALLYLNRWHPFCHGRANTKCTALDTHVMPWHRGAQIMCARSPWWLNFVQCNLMFKGPQFAPCCISALWRLELWDESLLFRSFVHPIIVCHNY